ncbi:MAG: hypothetical protein PHW96_04910 [Candidatus Nanoarchaeia archaeon]|nr:hypothetical protein [Candidatus Nanoarchaeia archaeon]
MNKILSGKEKRDILSEMNSHYGIDIVPDVVFVESGKGKVWIVNKSINKIDISNLNIERFGTYVLFRDKYGVRFTIEGSQIFGNYAKRNIVEIQKTDIDKWIRGFDLDIETETNKYIIIKHKDDFLGCGKGAKGIIQNYLPKSRRIMKL